MLRIGIECEQLENDGYGVGRILENMLHELAHRHELRGRIQFFLYFKSHIPRKAYLESPLFKKRVLRIPFVPASLHPISFSLYYYILLPIWLWFEKIDIMFFPNYMLPLLFRGTSVVTLTEDLHYEMENRALPFRFRLAYKIFSKWAASHATHFITVSETSKQAVSRLFHIPLKKISANPNAVDVKKFKKRVSIANSSLPTKNYLLYVGQAFPRRHLRESLLAFEKIAPAFPDLSFIVIGKDKYIPPVIVQLQKQVNNRLKRKAVTYKERVNEGELIFLYQNAQALIYISSNEAFGFPPLEALAAGTVPVIALSNVTKEIYNNHAFFVKNPHSIDDIAKTMKETLTNKQKRQEIYTFAGAILKKYTVEKNVDRFLEITQRVALNKKTQTYKSTGI